MYFCRYKQYGCPYATEYGYCQITCCIDYASITYWERKRKENNLTKGENNMSLFHSTIEIHCITESEAYSELNRWWKEHPSNTITKIDVRSEETGYVLSITYKN